MTNNLKNKNSRQSRFHKTIYLEVYAGLCNRLRALISGICLAEDLKYGLIIYWPSSKQECAASFTELYDISNLPPWVKVVDGFAPDGGIICQTHAEALIAAKSGISIRSNATFHNLTPARWHRHLQRLLPLPSTIYRVRKNLRILPKGLVPIGVHVRRTDNLKSIKESPLSGFEAAMRKIPNSFFYVASDDKHVAPYLNKKFPGRVFCHENVLNRNTIEGMNEAMVSLYTLASCSRIIGSYWSSFSGMAAQLRMRKIETIRGAN